MKTFVKVTILLVLLTLMLVSSYLVGFAEEKVIKFGRTEDLVNLDPCDNFCMANWIIEYMVYDRLVEWNPDTTDTDTPFVPGLATEWEISPDGREYTFKLREGVKFHNGEPFNAECVKVTLERFITNESLRRRIYWTDLKEVEVVDDYTVILRFNDSNVTCLVNQLVAPMLPAKAFKEKGEEMFNIDGLIGTGAFTWGHWKRGQEIVVNKNPDYWGKPAYMDKFIYFTLGEQSTRLAAVINGEIDVADGMNMDHIQMAEASGNVEVIRLLAWDQIYLALKNDKPPFNDIKFRQAMDLAIDKEGIVRQILKGGRVTTGVLVPGIFGFDDSLVPEKQDIEKAKQLVKESNYDGRTIDIMVPVGWFPKEKEVAQSIYGSFKEVGINSNLSILEPLAYFDVRFSGKYDIFLNEDLYNGDISQFLMRLIAIDTHKMGNINPEVQKLIFEQATITDEQKRIEVLREIEDIIKKDHGPIITICQFEDLYFQRKGIQGVRYYSDRIPDFRYARYEGW